MAFLCKEFVASFFMDNDQCPSSYPFNHYHLQFLYDRICLTSLFLILLIIFILVTILFQKKKKKIRWTDNIQVWTKVILRSKI